MSQSRREFFRQMGIGLGSGAMLATLDNLSLTSAMAQGTGYRALVCVFLGGGNDGNNTIIPITDYSAYQSARQASGTYPNGIYYTQAQLNATRIQPATVGRVYALHPAFAPLMPLWNQGRLAAVCNAGPLIRPLVSPSPRQAYLNNPTLRPPQLFSHSDQVQQWQTAVSNAGAQTGWGGRTADRFPPHASGFPMVTSIAGSARFTIGVQRRPLTIPTANPTGTPNLGTVLVLNGFSGDAQGPSRRAAMDFLRTIDNGARLNAAASNIMDQANAVAQALATANVTLPTAFPNTGLGNQLLQVARVIKANMTQPVLGLTHQIFFVSIGGFDTHRNQPASHNNLWTQLSNALLAFYNWTVADLGDISSRVTTFTMTDFGRTMNPAASGAGAGSDHAWGNHAFILGGSVRGGDLYGVRVYNGSPYPDLRMGAAGTMDTDTRGRWVPTTSVDQYANTLAKWFGLPQDNATVDAVFPLLRNGGFTPMDLGFMNPLP